MKIPKRRAPRPRPTLKPECRAANTGLMMATIFGTNSSKPSSPTTRTHPELATEEKSTIVKASDCRAMVMCNDAQPQAKTSGSSDVEWKDDPVSGDLVWAKVGSVPFWPAQVVDLNCIPHLKRPFRGPPDANSVLVQFFGRYDCAYVTPGPDLLPFEPNLISKCARSKSRLFKNAVEEALAAGRKNDSLLATPKSPITANPRQVSPTYRKTSVRKSAPIIEDTTHSWHSGSSTSAALLHAVERIRAAKQKDAPDLVTPPPSRERPRPIFSPRSKTSSPSPASTVTLSPTGSSASATLMEAVEGIQVTNLPLSNSHALLPLPNVPSQLKYHKLFHSTFKHNATRILTPPSMWSLQSLSLGTASKSATKKTTKVTGKNWRSASGMPSPTPSTRDDDLSGLDVLSRQAVLEIERLRSESTVRTSKRRKVDISQLLV
ncbi:hypothetical protein DFS34DRAFT_102785 [Phlyctochytrium arcticum]|nr:hypothetical protein DFS34DRAFT_102785 [Phlyctochytrium arcticum]